MNNNLSLQQGKQYNQKIKLKNNNIKVKNTEQRINTATNANKKEGFVSSTNQHIANNLTEVNQSDLEELNQLQNKYNDLLNQYTAIQKTMNDSSLTTINRVSSNNPYSGKNVKFNNGVIAYVTQQGVLKPYTNTDIYNTNVGKNGCPSDFVSLDIPWLSEYIKGSTIPTNPSLLVGSNMEKGESCGNEGYNVYASKLVNNPVSSYVGCFNNVGTTDTNIKSMIPSADNNITSYDKCQEYALDNGYKYFGLQNYQSDGTTSCVVSNDLNTVQMYGSAEQVINPIPIWSSNTAGNTDVIGAYINPQGNITLNDNAGNIIWQSPNAPSDCSFGGYVNPNTIQGSWGGNCVGKPLNIDCGNPSSSTSYDGDKIIGNLNEMLKNKVEAINKDNQASWSYNPILDWTAEDPAPCCEKLVDYSYQCGGSAFKTGQISGGSNINFECSNEANNCSFFLILQSDGNVCLYRGSDPSNNRGFIWQTGTNGKQKSANTEWQSINGKYGRNYLKLNEYLGVDEWISSDDGSLKLILQSDGNLVLYTSTVSAGCINANNKVYGSKNINAVYKLDTLGNKSILGNVANIGANSVLNEYPTSMLSYSNTYQLYPNTDSVGNDITTLVTSDQNGCETACNDLNDCSAYVYQASSSTCWLKNNNAYPKGNKQTNNATTLGVRNPSINNNVSSTCSKKIMNIDTIQYDNYIKGSQMTESSKCSEPVVSQEDQLKYDNIRSQLLTIGEDIINKMTMLTNEDINIYKKINTNTEQFKKDLEKYKAINLKIQKEINNYKKSDSNIEGMQNFKTMTDINGMLTDSDLKVLQGNYSYIMWSILAIGVLTITINVMKK